MYDDLVLFVNLVRFGGFTKAAKYTGLNQSTITRRIQSLEKELKITLINRTPRQLELTDKGRAIYEQFKDYETKLKELVSSIYLDGEETYSVTLRVSLPISFSYYAITPHLGKFIEDNPNLNFNIYYQYYEIDMIKTNYDIAIVSFLPNQVTQKVKLLFKEETILCCSKSYVEKHGLLTGLNQQSLHTIISPISQNDTRLPSLILRHNETGAELKLNSNHRIAVNNFLHAKAIVKTDVAIGVFPKAYVRSELETGELVRIFPDYNVGEYKLYLLRNIEDTTGHYKRFIDFLEQCFEKLGNFD